MNKAILIMPIIAAVLLNIIPSVMAQRSGYNLTVKVTSWTFGHDHIKVEIQTANGYYDSTNVYTSDPNGPSATFSIPANQGGSIKVCVPNGIISDILDENCNYYTADGSDMIVSMAQR
jgi:hypothetical protein